MPSRLSSPLTELKAEYEVVVVGSGYGGGIAASRLARAGKQVCLLERGRELQPGEYPDTAPEAIREFQVDSPAGRTGDEAGLYDLHLNDEISVFVGCGLGGTSLVNANVSIEAEPRVFEDPCWPKALRDDVGGRLSRGYDQARLMLKPVDFPFDTPKLRALKASADAMRAPFIRPPINVTFEAAEGGFINHVGVRQNACTLCGDCVTGCNHGAKNTVLMNYLPDARNHGASIFTMVSVTHLTRAEAGWNVHYRLVGAGRELFDAPGGFVRAKLVVLAAGTLGSTGILLRSKARGLALSGELGRHFTGNGDVLGFSYNGEAPVRGVGFGHRDPDHMSGKVGPCISGAIDLRGQPELEKGMIIEEGSLPGALAPILPLAFSAAAVAAGKPTDDSLASRIERTAREADSLIEGAYAGAMQNTQTYLVMTHDDAAGTLVLEDDRVRVRWPRVGAQPVFRRVERALDDATVPSHGIYVQNPLSEKLAGQNLITVHPLGGCAMAEDASKGVVNHKGQVFSGTTGDAVYPDVYVSDGSVIPRSLGVNPLLTISALAERTWMLWAEEEQMHVDYSLPSAPEAPAPPRTVGIRFTERMAGFVSGAVNDDYAQAATQGEIDRTPLEFTLTISTENLATLLEDPDETALVIGTVTAPSLSASPLETTEGVFNLLPPDPQHVETRRMRYRMKLVCEEGKTFFFDGHKVVHDDPRSNVWLDTTTLFFTVQENDEHGKLVGKGVLRIGIADFAKQLTTLEATNATSVRERLESVVKFGKHFAGALFDVYGGVIKPLSSLRPDEKTPRKKRPLRVPAPEMLEFAAADGVKLRLLRYRGGDKGPVLLVHGIGTSSAIFVTDTIETNLCEYLCAHGYDLWTLDHRASIAMPSASTLSTLDDLAGVDLPAAVSLVRAKTGTPSVQVVAHCSGAAAFLMAQLNGLEGVRSAVLSQMGTHLEVPFAERFKCGLHIPEVLEALGIRSVKSDAGPNPDWEDDLIDSVLRLEPRGTESCQSATCHRIAFLYGIPYDHSQLAPLTHQTLHELYGIANIRAFEHLSQLTRKRHLVDALGHDVYLAHPERLKLPLSFIHGSDNLCSLPTGTQKTVEWLTAQNGELYSRHVIQGYGHADCIIGRDAAQDVYPHILRHLEDTEDDAALRRTVAAVNQPLPARPADQSVPAEPPRAPIGSQP